MTETVFYVYFVRGAADLETAAEAFPRHGLTADRTPSALVLTAEKLRFEISLNESEGVPAAAAEAGKSTEFETEMAGCTARFEVRVSDLERALDEINIIMELQGALQDCCGGFVFLPWNHGIIEPWVSDDGL